jgi:hypothetical protein
MFVMDGRDKVRPADTDIARESEARRVGMDSRRKTVGSDKCALTVHSRLKQGTQGEVVRRRRLRSRIFLCAACVQPVNWRRG